VPRGKAQKTWALIDAAHEILAEIQPASVRAVCYRLFTKNLIASMAKSETNKVSKQLTWARENSIIPWDWIVDDTRKAMSVVAWENPATFVRSLRDKYRRDRWTTQPNWIELWSEKQTIIGTLLPVLDFYGVTYRVQHGYGSSTAIHDAAIESGASRKQLEVLYVGDWDPSGLHMSEVDLPRRIKGYGGAATLTRLALTREDIESGIPSFSADTKKNDSRYPWFRSRYGGTCWELDALSPVILRDRVELAIRDRLDLDAWRRADIAEQAEQQSIAEILSTWPGISGPASKYSGGGAA